MYKTLERHHSVSSQINVHFFKASFLIKDYEKDNPVGNKPFVSHTDHTALKDDASDNESFVWPNLTSKCFMFTFTQYAIGAEVIQTQTPQKLINCNLQVYQELRDVQKQAEPLVFRLNLL